MTRVRADSVTWRWKDGSHRDLGVGDGNAVEALAAPGVAVREAGVEAQAHAMCRIRPLALEVLGRGDDGDAVDDAPGDELGGHPEREGGLAGARGGGREEVARERRQVLVERLLLPGTELLRGAAGGVFWERGREMFGGRGAHESGG